jgi:serine protease Do
MSTLLQQLNDALSDMVTSARRGLVQITNGARGSGAGTIWHPEGLIITNAHVIAGRHALTVTLPDGRTLPANVLAADPDRDLAALAVEASDLPTVELGNSKRLRPGDWVLAVGHPWGITGAATGGVVIGVGTNLPEIPRAHHEWIALDLHMRPGHSGGPLVDVNGRLVGINTMIAGPDVGFAVPVHVVKRFLKDRLGA